MKTLKDMFWFYAELLGLKRPGILDELPTVEYDPKCMRCGHEDWKAANLDESNTKVVSCARCDPLAGPHQ